MCSLKINSSVDNYRMMTKYFGLFCTLTYTPIRIYLQWANIMDCSRAAMIISDFWAKVPNIWWLFLVWTVARGKQDTQDTFYSILKIIVSYCLTATTTCWIHIIFFLQDSLLCFDWLLLIACSVRKRVY